MSIIAMLLKSMPKCYLKYVILNSTIILTLNIKKFIPTQVLKLIHRHSFFMQDMQHSTFFTPDFQIPIYKISSNMEPDIPFNHQLNEPFFSNLNHIVCVIQMIKLNVLHFSQNYFCI
jgi:hypothetical protein